MDQNYRKLASSLWFCIISILRRNRRLFGERKSIPRCRRCQSRNLPHPNPNRSDIWQDFYNGNMEESISNVDVRFRKWPTWGLRRGIESSWRRKANPGKEASRSGEWKIHWRGTLEWLTQGLGKFLAERAKEVFFNPLKFLNIELEKICIVSRKTYLGIKGGSKGVTQGLSHNGNRKS